MLAIPLTWKAAGAGILAALLIAAGSRLYHHIERSGYDRAIAAVAAQDQEAINAADAARDRIFRCRASGGVWRTSAGQCERR
jgi:hypothetical protein